MACSASQNYFDSVASGLTLDQIAHVSAEIEASGARAGQYAFARRLRRLDHDPVVPAEWREAWEWRCASAFLDTIDVHHQLRNLFVERQ